MEKKTRYRIDKSKLDPKSKAMPAYMKNLNNMILLGKGSVVVMHENHSRAMVASDEINAMLGTVEVPLDALIPVSKEGVDKG